MIDFATIAQDDLIAKGQYAIVRGAHEKAKERLAGLCSLFGPIAPQILRLAQPDKGAALDNAAIAALVAEGRALLDKIEACVAEVEALGKQRAELKKLAWGSK